MKRGKYVGPRGELRGYTALLKPTSKLDRVEVQFDDVGTGYGYGWYNFRMTDFTISEGV